MFDTIDLLDQGFARPGQESQDRDFENIGLVVNTFFLIGLKVETETKTSNFETAAETQMKVVETIMDKTSQI